MACCVFDKITGVFLSGAQYDMLSYDAATQVEITLPYFPDRRTVRWDGVNNVRPATQQEIDDYDADQKAQIADAQLKMAGASILEAVYAIAYEKPVLQLFYQFIRNPTLYATQNAFLTALQSTTAFPDVSDLKALAKQNFIAKLNGT